ncbi:tripartite tricarboxylate transporter substrate binding protein [Paracoccus benzoatiresistens]|uniref:Tripartite tricarboxylate transporter substrate-binding protein n=1 Tax=Paracoccus benzoatiresistens TaxID=2997341 RepID=A0ABT4J1G5_9RHOB|nr:tripartite tricarboxylate transporter substrate-binding protein [Paracoccus sp. EF6]MCZ0960959.1 tripartite tricarboxylate transporter substrate-binding protein [Paracoccus sp. EF6]
MTKTKTGLLAATALMLAAPAFADFAPTRPVEFIVASGAGGGTDNFARTIQAVLTRDEIVERPIVVLNKGGGSGAEAFLYARQNEGDPHKLVFGTNNVYLLPHVAKLAYTVEDLQPVAALALDEFLVWVKADSPYQNVMDLVNAAKEAPGTIPFGGSQSKDTDETLVALIEQTTGADFKYVPFNGGGEVGVQLAGGHVAANVNNPNENAGQWQAGAIRPLCVFAPQRMAESEPVSGDMGWHDIPTCKEQGLEIESYQMPRTVWLPAGTEPEVLAYYQAAMQKVAESQDWKDYLAKTSQSASFLTGNELAEFIKTSEANAVKVFEAEGWTAQ